MRTNNAIYHFTEPINPNLYKQMMMNMQNINPEFKRVYMPEDELIRLAFRDGHNVASSNKSLYSFYAESVEFDQDPEKLFPPYSDEQLYDFHNRDGAFDMDDPTTWDNEPLSESEYAETVRIAHDRLENWLVGDSSEYKLYTFKDYEGDIVEPLVNFEDELEDEEFLTPNRFKTNRQVYEELKALGLITASAEEINWTDDKWDRPVILLHKTNNFETYRFTAPLEKKVYNALIQLGKEISPTFDSVFVVHRKPTPVVLVQTQPD